MARFRVLLDRLRALRDSDAVRREIGEEVRFHLEMRTEENIRRGMPPDEARRDAERRFGNQTRIREQGYEVRGGGRLETVWQDLRYGARVMWKRPLFSVVTVLTLTLGIGANSAIFSVVNAVLLRPLPYKDPGRLVLLAGESQQNPEMFVSYPNFLDWREQNEVFEQMAMYKGQGFNLTGGDRPDHVLGRIVSANFFQTLGVDPALGRTFAPEEDKPGADPVVVISRGLWQRRFGSDPALLGRSLSLDGHPHTVVGVVPDVFEYLGLNGEVWVPLGQFVDRPGWMERDTRPGTRVLARLKQGVTLEQARANMRAVAGGLARAYPETNTGHGVSVNLMHERLVRNLRPALLVLLAAVVFVLLIACANVANLLLASGAGRRKEISIRAALGAGRARLVRQLLTENLLLALAGGGLGLLLAFVGVDLLMAANPGNIPRLREITVDGRVLGFTLLLSALTGLVFGLVPAFLATKGDLNETLKEGGRGSSAGPGRRLRGALVVAEVAISLVLLAGAGLLGKSFLRLLGTSPGFDPRGVLTAELSPPQSRYPEDAQLVSFYQQVLGRVRSLPGVEAAGIIQSLPLEGAWENTARVEGQPPPPGEEVTVGWFMASPDYHRAMGVPLLAGRAFSERDMAASHPVVIVDEALARRFFGSAQAAVGKRLIISDSEPQEIVGVVGQVKSGSLTGEPWPAVYEPYAQMPARAMHLVIRASADPAGLVAAVRQEVHALDKEQPVFGVKTMEQVLAGSVSQQRLTTVVLGLFAFVSLVLAAVGIYGVVAYSVVQRRHEFGVRMALGAQPRHILGAVLRHGMGPVLFGILVGTGGALASARVISSLLYDVSETDPLAYVGVPVLLALVALLACYIPARRAVRVDPLIALRGE